MQNRIIYCSCNSDAECIAYRNVRLAYPVHTHASHVTIGYITEDMVRITADGRERCYDPGDSFCIMPDVPHKIEMEGISGCSMISICFPAARSVDEAGYAPDFIRRLKQIILSTPENLFPIRDMASVAGVSPYHMIRRFKAACQKIPYS